MRSSWLWLGLSVVFLAACERTADFVLPEDDGGFADGDTLDADKADSGSDGAIDAARLDAPMMAIDMNVAVDMNTPIDMNAPVDMNLAVDMSVSVDMHVAIDMNVAVDMYVSDDASITVVDASVEHDAFVAEDAAIPGDAAVSNPCSSNPCGAGTCMVDGAGYECSCNSGYQLSMDSTTCVDIDECTTMSVCDALTTCSNTTGSFTCSACPSGYNGTGETACTDIDECTTMSVCDALTTCSNTPGSFTCSACPSGYSGTGLTSCVDIDECASGYCMRDSTCSNSVGSYTCTGGPTVATSGTISCAINASHQLKCWGLNTNGQLGYGDTTQREVPGAAIDLGTSRTATAVAANGSHTCAILDNGKVKCWGLNTNGQLGYGDTTTRGSSAGQMGDSLPYIELGTDRTAKRIAVGQTHTCAVLDDHTLKCWGLNSNGQLGVGDTTTRNTPAAVNVGTGRTVRTVSPGKLHTCAVLDDGSVSCWGAGSGGVLGYGDSMQRTSPGPAVNVGTSRTARSVSVSEAHACAILDDNSLKCWGTNSNGQLGDNTTTSSTSPGATIDVGVGRTAWMVTTGTTGTCAILDDRTLRCWGGNTSGQLGYGDVTQRNLPSATALDLGAGRTAVNVSLTVSHTCALLDDGGVKCWGLNTNGQIGWGLSTSTSAPTVSVNFGIGRTAKAVGAGGASTCAILDDDSVRCWGGNTSGQLGYGDVTSRSVPPSTPVNLGSGRTASSISLGSSTTCAILDDGTLHCWGSNSTGQLGIGDTDQRNSPPAAAVDLGMSRTARQVAVGANTNCVVRDDNTLACFGANTFGQLGINKQNNQVSSSSTPVDVLNLTGRTVLSVSSGSAGECIRLDDSTLRCWGNGAQGQLGLGETSQRNQPISAVLLGTSRTARAVVTSGTTACAILDNNTLKCWGKNDAGQLGLGDTTNRGGAGTVGDSLPTVDLGTGRYAVALSTGAGNSNHVCALLDNGSVKCWGPNASGQLGVGDTTARGNTSGQMGDSLPAVNLGAGRTATAISVSGGHSCALLDNNRIKCWGSNSSGQLGYDFRSPPMESIVF